MTATISSRTTTFLRRAGLLAGMLAIIAGIFGMHILTGSHSMPTAAAGPGTDASQMVAAPAAGHTGHAQGPTAAPDTSATQGTTSMPASSCADPGACTTMSAMDAVCIPSPGTTSLAAPLPGTTPFAVQDGSNTAVPATAYVYLPSSPSPGELCISRT